MSQTRLQRYLRQGVKIRHPEDVASLRQEIREIRTLLDWEIQDLYEAFCEQQHYVEWVSVGVSPTVNSRTVDEFRDWLNS